MAKVLLAMSGGVDSTVAAVLLLRQGHEVAGVFMRHLWQQKHELEDAETTADRLGIELLQIDLAEEFRAVVRYFTDEYLSGRTPNPCADCNRRIKFGRLFDEMKKRDFDFLATGHYIRIQPHEAWQQEHQHPFFRENDPSDLPPAICCGRDHIKDQSYIMFGVAGERLSKLLFPVGEYDKNTIRDIAKNTGFDFSKIRESQEICFVPDQQHVAFIRTYGRPKDTSGKIVTTEGQFIIAHDGFEQFTIGQRKGMKIGLGGRRYVVRIDAETRDVVVGTRENLLQSELVASGVNWLIAKPQKPFPCRVKIRYRSPAVEALVTPLPDDRFHVRFDSPREAITPGQVAACYLDDRIIGGGWIQ